MTRGIVSLREHFDPRDMNLTVWVDVDGANIGAFSLACHDGGRHIVINGTERPAWSATDAIRWLVDAYALHRKLTRDHFDFAGLLG